MEVPQTLIINLEIIPTDQDDPDPAEVNGFASKAFVALQHDGYPIKTLPTGQRGGLEVLFQLTIQGIKVVDSALLAAKDTIDVLSSLCTIFTTVSAPILLLFNIHKKHESQEQKHSITLKMKIDNEPIEITSTDVADDERIVQLAERFHSLHPQIKPTLQSNITVQAHVPKKHSRPKR